jgi:DNA replication initiation complex subunit (GINS family)
MKLIKSPVHLAHPNLNLTPEEKRVFKQLFQAADTENIGVVTGENAVKFFERTRLEPRVLGEVWKSPVDKMKKAEADRVITTDLANCR